MKAQQLMLIREVQADYAYDEAIRTLRTNILFSGTNLKVIMFTSSLPDEGKSSISFAIARSLAQIGKRTILVDADIRKSVLLRRCEMEGEETVYGLSQYLSGQRELPEIIFQTNEENMSLIFSGPYSPNPAELLEEERCGQMFDELRKSYDYVIVDTPPMATLADGAIVASNCDGAVMVIESGAVSYKLEQKVKSQLEKADCRILGVVLNKVDVRSRGYYGKYGKYGKYEKYEEYGRIENDKRYAKKKSAKSAKPAKSSRFAKTTDSARTVDSPKSTDSAKSIDSAKPTDSARTAGSAKSTDSERTAGSAKPTDSARTAGSAKPTDSERTAGSAKPTDSERTIGSAKTTDSARSIDSAKSADSARQERPAERDKDRDARKPSPAEDREGKEKKESAADKGWNDLWKAVESHEIR